MRAGLAYARAFALARDIPAYGLDVFKALRLTVPANTPIAIDSRRGDFFIDEISAIKLNIDDERIVSAAVLAAYDGDVAGSWSLPQPPSSSPTLGRQEPALSP